MFAFVLASCEAGGPEIDTKKLAAQPKSYVGSDQCKLCHLEHYDSWRTTLHSRTLQDVTKNRDALITEINPALVRADLKDLEKDLRIPLDKVYIPNENDIRYTIGIQWKQQFLVEKNGALYIAPIQYNAWTNKWVNYHEDDWDKRPWIRKCGGCHSTGVDLEKNTFSEPVIGLIMAYPLFSTRFIPGWGLNVVLWVHRIEAIMAMAHIFSIHFFIGHLRRHNFPMDCSMFEGSVDLEAASHEKPFWVARLAHAGKLEELLVPQASIWQRAVFYLFGYTAIAVGLFLLFGGLVNSRSITW